MAELIFNNVLRLNGHGLNGFYRIVATPTGRWDVWLAFIAPHDDGTDEVQRDNAACKAPPPGSLIQVSRATLTALQEDEELADVELDSPGLAKRVMDLDANARALWLVRQTIMEPFLNHEALSESLLSTAGIGSLVRTAMVRSACTRATVYRLWRLLCIRGFTAASLRPDFERCGAPGVPRPMDGVRKKAGNKSPRERLGEPEPFPQRGMTEDDRTKLVLHYRRLARPADTILGLYDRVIEAVYVTRYTDTGGGRVPVMPLQGTFPNKRQFRHAIETETRRIERRLRRTTEGHFQRNRRGLRGPNYHGVVGPGHQYAIDSTVGDVHLRSSINRAWIIGRPIVYLIVDIWSTAIVGFYVCLNGPSWDTAKLALFSAFVDPRLIAELWGYAYADVLTPAPTMPFMLLCDRGEYLSAAARVTGRELGLNLAFNPAYRPDLKGLVEVLHRIAKDEQYRFIPGAIDARRRELELKSDPKESVMTMREYVAFLQGVFVHYNLFANRDQRLTTEMIAAGVQPSPAGLWRFGHEAGLGYRKRVPREELFPNLLHKSSMAVRRNGVFVESLRYECELATSQRWTEEARNFGAFERSAFLFPGSASRVWTPDSDGIHQFNLSSTARTIPETTLDEWRDSVMYSMMDRHEREYRRLCAAATNIVSRSEATKKAKELTDEAEAAYVGQKLTTKEARDLERLHGELPAQHGHEEPASNFSTPDFPDQSTSCSEYESTMNETFTSFNAEVAGS